MITSLVSIPRLRALLTAELAAPLRPAAPHRARLTHEIEEVWMNIFKLNTQSNMFLYFIFVF